MVWSPEFRRLAREGGGPDVYVVGHPLVDDFLEFARGVLARTRCGLMPMT
jgi:hypothetical protein